MILSLAVRFSSSFSESDPTQTGPSGSRDNLFKSPLLTKTMRKETYVLLEANKMLLKVNKIDNHAELGKNGQLF